jgi:uncharacterized OB-fold protein
MPELPVPPLAPNVEADVHFDGLRSGRLLLPRCDACATVIWYPRTFCPACASRDVTWIEASGRGVVHSYTVVHKGTGLYADAAPYVVAYVELDEGPRIMTNIVGPTDGIAIGDTVVAEFPVSDDNTPILRFRLTR